MNNLATTAKITWCPGCPNSAILVAFRQAVAELIEAKKIKPENIVIGAGIGCHGKIADYLNLNSFTSLHGRILPALTGIKCANPQLTVIGFSGDGDSFSEGLEHLLHAARRNSDLKVFLHDNQVFALTTGQVTALSPKGYKGKSTPDGSWEEPFLPLPLLLEAGATFLARTYAGDIAGTKKIMLAAIAHRGFAFVEIIQPCLIFFDTREYFKDRLCPLPADFPVQDKNAVREFLAQPDTQTPVGIFYQVVKPTYEEQLWR
ncbi:MAG TPA: thiamine pyrophosphate-dependent enzyme [Candidatus Paceibacterota bacterium]